MATRKSLDSFLHKSYFTTSPASMGPMDNITTTTSPYVSWTPAATLDDYETSRMSIYDSMLKDIEKKKMEEAKPVMWTLEQGLELLRSLQSKARDFNYHICLGGGILNKGESKKDLDLFFLPMDNGTDPDDQGLLTWLKSMWGEGGPFNDGYLDSGTLYYHKLKFDHAGKRIDVFIM